MDLVDTSRWPLIVVRWPDREADADEVEQVLAGLTRCYGRRHAVMHDSVRTSSVPSRLWMRLAEYTREHEEEIRSWVIASAAVAPSLVLRGLVASIQRLAPPPSPFQMFASRDAAEEWLMLWLRRCGALVQPSSG